jgi:hypothetical protein
VSVEPGLLPRVGRREAFLLAGGAWPVFFRGPELRMTETDRRVHVYVDVSASTRAVWPEVYGLILHLREEIGDRVWQFSTEVKSVPIRDLARGVVWTTGGTHFNPIFETAFAERQRRILVITDGDARLGLSLADRVRREGLELYLVLTEENETSPLQPLAARTWQVPWPPRGR